MYQIPRHKVFISFHHEDQFYKNLFVEILGDDIVDKSVEDGDIDDSDLTTDEIRRKIRNDFIQDATVTVVLVGPCTWQRKHVDWEIGSSLQKTKRNPRCGLLGIWLPNHPDYEKEKYKPCLLPPRLADNYKGNDSYAQIYDWSPQTSDIRCWIHRAFERRNRTAPNNGRPQFKQNRAAIVSMVGQSDFESAHR